ncbi:MAG: DUF5009 domain-containing protein [Calditrichae bacterium]|nr:DUF5009 domain-containing protein [Calditrichia bacterium]
MNSTKRALSLDALRGFAILTMVLSGVIPYKVLPSWMYHAQVPPPDHVFNPDLPGLTWVDLVFPLFIFALGAAIPLALGKRLEQKTPLHKIIYQITERAFLLGFFAIFLQHMRPHQISNPPDTFAWLIALFAFLLMFALFARFPAGWNSNLGRAVKTISWLIAIILLWQMTWQSDKSFSFYRSDIIIIVLTNVYFFGSLFWLLTRDNLLGRLAILGILLALRLAHNESGWVQDLWEASPAPWIYKLYYLQYLFIAIPGTIAGDLVVKWMKEKDEHLSHSWTTSRMITIAGLMAIIVIISLVGLQARWLLATTIINVILLSIGCYLMKSPASSIEKLISSFFKWGTYWFILGLIFEPFEGGIKKDHSTMSYYLITAGVALFILIAFTVIIDGFKQKKALNLLILNGQNPMIAYVGFANLIWPVLALSGLEEIILSFTSHPWIGFLRGLLYTILLAYIVAFFSRKKIFWRT